jgi:large subunit ribosomal protein L21
MFAVVEIAGKQYKVSKNDKIFVPTLEGKEGAKLRFDKVLLVGGEKDVQVGHPLVPGVTVEGTIVQHGKGEKVLVFKKKKRKGFRVKRGHRQGFTRVEITGIGK